MNSARVSNVSIFLGGYKTQETLNKNDNYEIIKTP